MMELLDRAHKQGLVVGLREIDGTDPISRLDIDVLLHDYPDTFNLLLIAFKEFKGEDLPDRWKKTIGDGFRADGKDKMYWQQVAGIHGLPRSNWDNEEKKFLPKPGGENGLGYCIHQDPTFCPWHRPYLSMIEQSLYRQAVHVVERFEKSARLSVAEKKAYRDALKMFRMPYWDYFRARDRQKLRFPGVIKDGQTTAPFDFHVPRIFTVPKVMIRTLPDNELELMDNPFFNYKFQVGDLSDDDWEDSEFSKEHLEKSKTIRWGGDDDKCINEMNQAINKVREDNVRTILHMFDDKDPNGYPNFKVFSTTGILKGSATEPDHGDLWFRYGSLESLHGSYHVYAGGFIGKTWDDQGKLNEKKWKRISHLICVPLSAWDPLFWFHHCQIDRLFAIYQAINPNSWFQDLEYDPDDPNNYLGPREKRPLFPFRKEPLKDKNDNERYWNSDQARSTETFGYTYPDIENGKSPEEVREGFANRYRWSRRLSPSDNFELPPKDMEPLDLRQAQVYQYPTGNPLISKIAYTADWEFEQIPESVTAAVQAVSEPGVSKEWFIDVAVEQMAVKNAFTIFFVLGDIVDGEDTGADWGSNPGFVGAAHVFTSPPAICDNCARHEEQKSLVTYTVAMASLLYDYVKTQQLASLNEADVVPFLVKKLKWKVQSVNGTVIDPRDLKRDHSFKISISVKTSPLPGQVQFVPKVNSIPDVFQQIIDKAS